MKKAFATQRRNMIDCQIKPFNVVDETLLGVFEDTPREAFVPEAKKPLAYLDEDMAFGGGRYLLGPSVYARLIQESGVTSGEKVLDVGCLMGYSTAILSGLGADVTAYDAVPWVDEAKKSVGKHKVHFLTGDLNKAPSGTFDIIFINGATETAPESFASALKEGGRIATFFRKGNQGHAVLYRKHSGALHMQILFDALVPVLPGFEKMQGFAF